jgi:nuclear pore complex protein Nup98-Nup96
LEWIQEAKAAQLASEGNIYEEFLELIEAGLVDRAHRILVGKLVPEAILRDDLALAQRLCEGLARKVPDGWEYGGKVGPSFLSLSLVRL